MVFRYGVRKHDYSNFVQTSTSNSASSWLSWPSSPSISSLSLSSHSLPPDVNQIFAFCASLSGVHLLSAGCLFVPFNSLLAYILRRPMPISETSSLISTTRDESIPPSHIVEIGIAKSMRNIESIALLIWFLVHEWASS